MLVVKGKLALMQVYAEMAVPCCAHATQSGVDWIRLREGLADVRRGKPLTVAELAIAIGVAETTVYRIENVKENPDHKPELPTILAWLTAANGPKVSTFLARYEGELPNARLHEPDELANNSLTPVDSEANHAREVPDARAAAVVLDHLIAAILHLSTDLATAAARAQIDRSSSGPRPVDATPRRDTDRLA